MDTNKIVETILENVKQEITQFVEIQPTITCPIEYEMKVLSVSQAIARQLIEQSQGKIPRSRNLKKKYIPYSERLN
jgi:hypothetical protein